MLETMDSFCGEGVPSLLKVLEAGLQRDEGGFWEGGGGGRGEC